MGDWFLFYMLGQNVDSMIFKEVGIEFGISEFHVTIQRAR